MEVDAQAVIRELATQIANLSVENAQLKALLSARIDKGGVENGNSENDGNSYPN